MHEIWYNTSYHSSLGYTPFRVYGHDPNQLGIDIVEACKHEDLDKWLKERDLMMKLVQQHLNRA
jgi:hypothetical protein